MPHQNFNDPRIAKILTGLARRVAALEQQFRGIKDEDGNTRVKWGQLPLGDYGISLSDPATGNVTTLLPVYKEGITTAESTMSTTYTDLATPGPEVTATIGMSGEALVIINSYIGVIGVASAQSGGFVGVSIDGNAPVSPLDEILYFAVSSGSEAIGIAGNQSAMVILTGLSVGQHTFEFKYKALGGNNVTFFNRFLQVAPI